MRAISDDGTCISIDWPVRVGEKRGVPQSTSKEQSGQGGDSGLVVLLA